MAGGIGDPERWTPALGAPSKDRKQRRQSSPEQATAAQARERGLALRLRRCGTGNAVAVARCPVADAEAARSAVRCATVRDDPYHSTLLAMIVEVPDPQRATH